MRHRGEHEIAARCVQHALGLAGRARGVEDEQRVLGVHLLGRTIVADLGELLLEPEVAARRPRHLPAGVLDDENLVDAAGLLQRRVGIGLERNLAAAAQAFVGGDQEARFAVLDAPGERVRREAAEHDGMDGADPRAGEHGVSGFRDHRQIDRHPVAALDPVRLQHIGEAADGLVQLAIGDVLRLLRGVVGLEDDGGLLAALLQMPVDAIGRDVEGAVLEPFDRHVGIGERGVLDARIGLDPVEPLALLAPELIGVVDAFPVELLVLVLVDIRAFFPFLGDLHATRLCTAYARTSVRSSLTQAPLSGATLLLRYYDGAALRHSRF